MALDTKVYLLSIEDILPNRFQPRIAFGEEKINELADSIRKYGVIQPIIVRSIGDKYEIIAGERRYKASIMAGLKQIPAIINNLDDKDSSEIALIENVQRENLTPIEEAISIKKILDLGEKTQEQLAEKLGVSQSAVANKLRLLNLNEAVQEALLKKKISERHARSLLRIQDSKKQKEMLDRIINERLTVKRLDEEIEKLVPHKKEEKKEIASFLPNEIKEKRKEEPEKEKKEEKESESDPDILEIINKYYKEKEKKETEKMNSNDPMNQFTVPNVPIENDIPQTVNRAVSNAPGVNNVETPALSPQMGFQPAEVNMQAPSQVHTSMGVENNGPIPFQNGQMNTNLETGKEPQGRFFDVLPSRQENMQNTSQENMQVQNPSILNNDAIFTNVEPQRNIEVEPVTPVAPAFTTANEKVEPLSSLIDPANLISRDEGLNPEPVQRREEKEAPTIVSPTPSMSPLGMPTEPNVGEVKEQNIHASSPLSFNMREAINMARDTGVRIENLGIQVDTEEMDAPDYYEITIRLMKEK